MMRNDNRPQLGVKHPTLPVLEEVRLKHPTLPVLEEVRLKHPTVYQELTINFQNRYDLCQEWVVKPKSPLNDRSPYEQLQIDPDVVMGMLDNMKRGNL